MHPDRAEHCRKSSETVSSEEDIHRTMMGGECRCNAGLSALVVAKGVEAENGCRRGCREDHEHEAAHSSAHHAISYLFYRRTCDPGLGRLRSRQLPPCARGFRRRDHDAVTVTDTRVRIQQVCMGVCRFGRHMLFSARCGGVHARRAVLLRP